MNNTPADSEVKLVCIGEKSRASIVRSFAYKVLFAAKDIGRAPPTFEDASIAANAILNSGYEFDEVNIFLINFKIF